MYDDIDEARRHAHRATGLHGADISIVREFGGFTLHVDPPAEADVVEVITHQQP